MVSSKVILLGAVVALLALAPSAAAEAKSFNVTGHVTDGQFFFTFEGIEGNNPTVPVAAGDVVTITYKTDTNVHNFHVGAPVDKQTTIVGPDGEAQTLTFTVPDSAATIEYWCDPHKGSGMMGTFTVSGANPPANGGDDTKDTPGFGAPLAVLAIAGALLLARRRA